MKFEDGIHDISIEDYHGSEGISRSSLMLMKKSPYHYWYERVSGQSTPRKATPAMVIGELVHTLCLEPHLYDERFAVGPDLPKTTKAGKEAWAQFNKELEGKEAIKVVDLEKTQAMASSFRSDSVCSTVIADAKFEQSIFFTHKETGLQCKARPDIWAKNIIGDLKTTEDAGRRSFQLSCHKYNYFLQAGMMKRALESVDQEMSMFVFHAVEKEPPYALANYHLSEEAIQYGVNLFDSLMIQIKECHDANSWPSYGTSELDLPAYLKDSNE